MIVSHKYQYIFLKTTKIAGTSIEISLSRFCDPDDIITPISLQDELMRKKPGIFPRNYKNHTCLLKSGEDNSSLELVQKSKSKTIFWNHIKAQEIKVRIFAKIEGIILKY